VTELLDLAQKIASWARPGEEVEAFASWQRETEVRAYGGEVESLSSAESAGVGVRVVAQARQGFAYVGNLDESLAREALAEARDNASFATPDANVGLASPDGIAPSSLELWDDSLGVMATEEKVALALELERQVRAGDPRIREVVSADYGDDQSEAAIASSMGISAASRSTTCYLVVYAVAGEGDDTQTGGGYSVCRAPSELEIEKASRDAVERATRMLGATKPPSGRVTAVFDREVTATLLSVLAGTLSGEEVAKGRSLFAGRLGEQVASASVTFVEDPTNGFAFGASRYDAEGLACRRVPLIDKGQLVAFLYDTYSARLAGARSTASAVRAGFKSTPGVGARALSLTPGDLDQAGVIGAVGEGLFIQDVSGIHSGVNPVSGDFSVGAEGLLIRRGELAQPVREITIASTIQSLLQGIEVVGGDIEWLPSAAAGLTIAIGDVAMSGS
jgi:PmbA protein